MPATEMPSTLRRSSEKPQRTWAKAHTTRSRRTVKESGPTVAPSRRSNISFEKKGDRWVAKDQKGPSDPRSAHSGAAARRRGKTYGGVDEIGNSHAELYERARKLGIEGRSRMSKAQLAEAIARKQ